MPTLAQATKRPANIDNLEPIIAPPPATPSLPAPPGPGAKVSPVLSGVLPAVFGTAPDFQRGFYGAGSAPATRIPPLPPQASIAGGAATKSQIIVEAPAAASLVLEVNGVKNPDQAVMNLTGTGVTYGPAAGQVQISSGAVGDGLVHGPGPWEIDSAYCMWREEFLPGIASNGYNAAGAGSLTWSIVGQAVNGGAIYATGAPPNMGIITWTPNTSVGFSGPGSVLTLSVNSSGSGSWQSMPLLDYPSWKATFIFKVEEAGVNQNSFTMSNKSLYVGFCAAMDQYNVLDLATTTRPRSFYGVRYDTSPGAISMGSSTIAASFQASYVTYTITSGGSFAANGSYVGQNITVTGYANANNNGTFLCVGSTASSLLLFNAGAVPGSGAGYTGTMVTQAGPSDSGSTGYVFECVNNTPVANIGAANYRNNLQGQTFNTNIVPTKGRWVRLDMTLATANQLQMTLVDGVTSSTHTFTISPPSFPLVVSGETGGQAGTLTIRSDGWVFGTLGNMAGTYNGAVTTVNALGTGYASFGNSGGSMLTFAGLTGGLSVLNGTWGPTFYNGSGSQINFPSGLSSLSATSPNAGSTCSMYPSLTPFFGFGNDDSNVNTNINCSSIYVDYFALCWNPGINPANALTPNSLKARYF